jgi:hypothetical protein
VVKNLRRHQVKILRGAKPAGLQVEQPTKFDLVINLITTKALGIDVPASLRARADEMIKKKRPISASGTFQSGHHFRPGQRPKMTPTETLANVLMPWPGKMP